MFCELQVKLVGGHKFDRDVELLIYYKDAHQPTAVVEAGQASAKPGECKLVKMLLCKKFIIIIFQLIHYLCWNK